MPYEKPLLLFAVETGNLEIIQLFLSNPNIDVNARLVFFLHFVYSYNLNVNHFYGIRNKFLINSGIL